MQLPIKYGKRCFTSPSGNTTASFSALWRDVAYWRRSSVYGRNVVRSTLKSILPLWAIAGQYKLYQFPYRVSHIQLFFMLNLTWNPHRRYVWQWRAQPLARQLRGPAVPLFWSTRTRVIPNRQNTELWISNTIYSLVHCCEKKTSSPQDRARFYLYLVVYNRNISMSWITLRHSRRVSPML